MYNYYRNGISSSKLRRTRCLADYLIHHCYILLAVGLPLVLLTACGGGKWPQREGFVNPDGVYIIHSPGIMGALGHDRQMARGFIRAGVQEVRLLKWTSSNTLKNLTSSKLHEREARKLVAEIIKLHEEHPEARIVLTAHSGGSMIAVRAIEILDESDPDIEQLWLFSPSLSPDYDFTKALLKVQTINAVCSKYDWLILGLGTRLFGTSDRVHTASAGKISFSIPHPRLNIWRYNSEWRKLGYSGDHMTSLAGLFIMFVVAPAVLEPDLVQYNQEFENDDNHYDTKINRDISDIITNQPIEPDS